MDRPEALDAGLEVFDATLVATLRLSRGEHPMSLRVYLPLAARESESVLRSRLETPILISGRGRSVAVQKA